jgi:hypothetical protein
LRLNRALSDWLGSSCRCQGVDRVGHHERDRQRRQCDHPFGHRLDVYQQILFVWRFALFARQATAPIPLFDAHAVILAADHCMPDHFRDAASAGRSKPSCHSIRSCSISSRSTSAAFSSRSRPDAAASRLIRASFSHHLDLRVSRSSMLIRPSRERSADAVLWAPWRTADSEFWPRPRSRYNREWELSQ